MSAPDLSDRFVRHSAVFAVRMGGATEALEHEEADGEVPGDAADVGQEVPGRALVPELLALDLSHRGAVRPLAERVGVYFIPSIEAERRLDVRR